VKDVFDDLRIVGVFTEKCYVTQNPVCRVYLELSAFPPLGWAYTLARAWEGVCYSGKPNVGTEGKSIWIECRPDEMRAVHLPWLERAIAQANDVARRSCQQRAAARSRELEAAAESQAKIAALAASMSPQKAPKHSRFNIRAVFRVIKTALRGSPRSH
jgi:hypothetical protein